MNALKTLLEQKRNKPLFMAHMIAGFPSEGESLQIARALVENGADIVEMQIPFSDPMADGPTIAVACEEALKCGASVKKSLKVLSAIAKLGVPVVVMSYTNPVYRYAFPRFAAAIKAAGASGLIVPDCPVDTPEGRGLIHACERNDLFLIPVVSPGVPKERLETLAQTARGFVYCTSRQGITGANSAFARALTDFLADLRTVFKLPIAVGFGVRTPADVKSLKKHVDIVIAGSVFVSSARKGGVTAVAKTMHQLRP